MKKVMSVMAAILVLGVLLSGCATTPEEPAGQTCAMYKN